MSGTIQEIRAMLSALQATLREQRYAAGCEYIEKLRALFESLRYDYNQKLKDSGYERVV